MEFFESFNVAGVKTIVYAQSKLPYSSYGFFVDILRWADTSSLYYYFFPFICAHNLSFGVSLLWALIYSEWATQLCQWIFSGDRPIWWVHETPYYLHKNLPYVRQYPLSCETGSGTPSQVVSVNSAAYFILIALLTSKVLPRASQYLSSYRQLISRILWITYAIWICLVMTSQVYVATHFPHQVFIGVIIGIGTAMYVRSKKVVVQTRREALNLTVVMLAFVGIALGYRSLFGEDPSSIIKKAIRWCIKREYLQIDDTPAYSMFRIFGLLLGLEIATSSSLYKTYSSVRFTLKMRLSLVILSLATGQAVLFADQLLPELSTIVAIYYSLVLVLYSGFAFTIVSLLPRFVMFASGVKAIKVKSKKP